MDKTGDNMEYNIEGNVLAAKLDDGMDLFEAIEAIMDDIEQDSAVVVSAIGMIDDFKVGFYNRDTGGYEWMEIKEPKELLSLKGSVTEEGSMHFHVEVAGKDHGVVGGHLDGGKVFNVVELTMLIFQDMKLSRKRDEELDMDLLSVR
ncbi:MAG: PPC domain-containing DNA-binding protein [Candidatus Aenigmatarchaeota archaeon]